MKIKNNLETIILLGLIVLISAAAFILWDNQKIDNKNDADNYLTGEVDPAQPIVIGEYLLRKSGIPVPGGSAIFWVDEETLLFSGLKGEKVRDDTYRDGDVRLFTWKLGQGQEIYAAEKWWRGRGNYKAYYYCADRKAIYYDDISQDTTYLWSGKLGEEKRKPKPIFRGRHPFSSRAGAGNRDNCEKFLDKTMNGRVWYAGSNNRFYIDYGRPRLKGFVNDPVGPIILIDNQTKKSTTLDIPLSEIRIGTAYHFRGTNRFLLWGGGTGEVGAIVKWKASNCWPFRMLSPDTKELQKYCIPFGDWAGGTVRILDTKEGVFYYSHRNASLYSLKNGKPVKVIQGVVQSAKVSPSGCRIAFKYIPSFRAEAVGESYLKTIWVLEVCEPQNIRKTNNY